MFTLDAIRKFIGHESVENNIKKLLKLHNKNIPTSIGCDCDHFSLDAGVMICSKIENINKLKFIKMEENTYVERFLCKVHEDDSDEHCDDNNGIFSYEANLNDKDEINVVNTNKSASADEDNNSYISENNNEENNNEENNKSDINENNNEDNKSDISENNNEDNKSDINENNNEDNKSDISENNNTVNSTNINENNNDDNIEENEEISPNDCSCDYYEEMSMYFESETGDKLLFFNVFEEDDGYVNGMIFYNDTENNEFCSLSLAHDHSAKYHLDTFEFTGHNASGGGHVVDFLEQDKNKMMNNDYDIIKKYFVEFCKV